jgi:tetratricopeptide (TPR) repeat protein
LIDIAIQPANAARAGGAVKQKPKSPESSRRSARARSAVPLSPRRKWLFRVAALILVPLLVLGGLEGVLRLAGYGYATGIFRTVRIGPEEFLVNNDSFGLRFFPPELVRCPGPIRLPVHKAAGTCRIFVLGESAAMGDPEPSFGASRYLEVLLNERYPKQRFEIVNLGITAINSHVILPIARECAGRDGDVWIIYMGNNEMVGPFGAATVFGAQAPPLALVRATLLAQKLRLGQLLADAGHRIKGGKSATPSWGGMDMFATIRLPPDDPRREAVYRNFRRNLHDIVRAGVNSGATVLLNTVAVNQRDCAPFASFANTNLPAADRAQFIHSFSAACRSEAAGDFAGAAPAFEQAAAIDPRFAEGQFRWGNCLAQLNQFPAAREHFQKACDDDALPFRADSRINEMIRAEGRRPAGDRLVLLDAALAGEPSGMCGRETFYEHVHFNFDGNYRLARLWADRVERLLPAGINPAAGGWAAQGVCERRLGLSDWNRILVLQHMIGRLQQPPFAGQSDHTQRFAVLKSDLELVRARTNALAAVQVRKDFQATLLRAPEDYLLRENFALFLQAIGDLPAATAEWRRIQEWLPHDYLACFQLGRLLGGQSQWTESETWLRRAVKMHPGLTEGWYELGNVLASQEKFEPALAEYSRARQQRPQDPQIAFRMGKALGRLKRHPEAIERYREVVRLDPGFWEAHYELGGELDALNQLQDAAGEFAEAARLNPGYSRAHFNLGVLLAKQGRLEEARREFQETIRLEPDYAKARDYLAQVNTMKAP